MSKTDFQFGEVNVQQFFETMSDRHRIWKSRFIDCRPGPWSTDPIFNTYKFTNVFRQLDRGTIALVNLLQLAKDERDIISTVGWYRLFNLDIHANYWYSIGHLPSCAELAEYMRDRSRRCVQVWTSAHMTCNAPGKSKLEFYLGGAQQFYVHAGEILAQIKSRPTMRDTYNYIKQFDGVGNFIAYEMVCDWRFTSLLRNALDKLTWANVGPGADRGMRRLGFKPSISAMTTLYDMANDFLPSDFLDSTPVPFELREIEHWLCEFDKYRRVFTKVGRPRQKYDPKRMRALDADSYLKIQQDFKLLESQWKIDYKPMKE